MSAPNEKQLLWRCRRGVRELDILLSGFLRTDYPDLNDEERRTFQRLLEIQDPVIMDWLFGRGVADDPELQKLIERLQQSRLR
ncbi:MAG: succinate dehydrogenase assembly factor 2 [Arenicella sp.]|nr:succinate dehydrogenase assembly factor 2 [Arenicella sp.]